MQRECHVAALLESIRGSIKSSQDDIWLNPEPKSKRDAVMNLYAFSEEGRQKQLFRDTEGAVQYTTVPPMRKCHGWTKIRPEFSRLPLSLRPPAFTIDRVKRRLASGEYYAIIYDYVPDYRCPMVPFIIQAQLDLFRLAGFCMAPPRPANWGGSGILLDMADLICPWHLGWEPLLYGKRCAGEILEPKDYVYKSSS